MGWIIRGCLLAGGTIASWFMSREAFQFPIMQFVCTLFLFMLLVTIMTFWPNIKGWFRSMFQKDSSES